MPANAPYAVFESAAARDATITAPTIGQAVMLKDTGEVLYYYGAHLGYRPPWNVPWGRAQYTSYPLAESGLGGGARGRAGAEEALPVGPNAEVAMPFTVVNGRLYRVTFTSTAWKFPAATVGTFDLFFYDNNTQPAHRFAWRPLNCPLDGSATPIHLSIDHEFPADPSGSASHAVVVTLLNNLTAVDDVFMGGNGPFQNALIELEIDDIGSARPPTYA